MSGAQARAGSIQGERVLVTGGSGFIGRAVCRHLALAGADVLNYDLRPWQGPDPGPRTMVGDIEDPITLAVACQQHEPSVVIHLAAYASVTASSRDDFTSIWNGTRVVAEVFAAAANRPRRFVNISTQLVIRQGPQPTDLTSYNPYTPYGEAKAEAEGDLSSMDRPFSVVHVRPTNIWGPHHPSYAHSLMRYLARGWYLHPTTTYPVVRTYGYVDNCAKQIISVAFSKTLPDNAILYSGDAAIDSAKFLDAMSLELRGRPVRRFPLSLLKTVGSAGTLLQRAGLPFPLDRERVMRMSTDYVVPLEPVHAAMAFPSTPFELGMRRAAQWYRAGANASWQPAE